MCVGERSALRLYRLCLRSLRELPQEVRDYYRNNARQNFRNFSDETDVERVRELLEHGKRSINFVLDKYRSGSPVRRI